MAIGDDAAKAGLAVFAPTQDKRLGYENDNVRGDDIAKHILSGTHGADKITGQFTTAQIANLAVTNGKLAPDAVTDPKIKAGEVKTRALADSGVTGPKIADTVTRTGSWVFEGNPLSIRGSVAKVTVGAATVIDAGSSCTINADGSILLEPGTYLTSMRTYGNTTTAKANVYIDGNGRFFRSTAATLLDVEPDYPAIIADLTARIVALEAAAKKPKEA